MGPVRRVGVLRALQLGDLLCAVPALRALRHALPDAHVVLVGLPWARSFVWRFGHYLDGFLELPGYPGLPEVTPDLRALPRFLADAHDHHFDLVVQMHGSGTITNPLAVSLGGRVTAGFYRPGQFCPDAERFLAYPEGEPEPRRLLALMRFLGMPSRGEHLEFPLHDDDRRTARAAVAGHLGNDRYVCIHPGARAAERRWPPEGFARVADALAERGAKIVLTGVEEEAALTAEVRARMQAPALDLAGRLSLGSLGALLAGASLVLCNDTGVSHIADALRVPSVVIYTASDPSRWAPLDRKLHRAVRSPMSAVSGAMSPSGVVPATSDETRETIERVMAEARGLLREDRLHAA